MRIELIRHGETALQAQGRYQGATDTPLSPKGRACLKKADLQPESVYVTPLLRTRETADILFPQAKQIEVPGLSEMDFGIFEERSAAEMENDPAYRVWVDGMCLGQCPGGESKEMFCERVCAAFSQLLAQAQERGETSLVIVAHGGTQMAALERFCAEKRAYYEWLLPCGYGWLLEAPNWKKEHALRVLDTVRYAEP